MLGGSSKSLKRIHSVKLAPPTANLHVAFPRHAPAVALESGGVQSRPESGLRHKPWQFDSNVSSPSPSTRSTVSQYNEILQKAADRAAVSDCFGVAKQMKMEGLTPDIVTYNLLMRAAAQSARITDAWAILEDMEAVGVQPTALTFNHLINATRAKPSQYLWGALDKMQNAGIQPNSLTYTLIIRYFAEAGNLELALRYMQITTNAGMSIDLRTMEAVISQAAARGFPRLAVELVMDFEKNTVRRIDPTVWLKCLASASDQRWADGVLQCWQTVVGDLNLSPDEGTCLQVLNTAARSGLPSLATQALQVLQQSGVEWQEHHLIPLVESFVTSHDLQGALASLPIIQSSGVTLSNGSLQSLIDFIAKDPETLDSARELVQTMHAENPASVNASALNAILAASAASRDFVRCRAIYAAFADLSIAPNVETFHHMLDCAVADEQADAGAVILTDMHEANVQPDANIFTQMIKLSLLQTEYDSAFYYLEEMQAAGHTPPAHAFLAIAHKCSSMADDRYLIVLQDMRDHGHTVTDRFEESCRTRFAKATLKQA